MIQTGVTIMSVPEDVDRMTDDEVLDYFSLDALSVLPPRIEDMAGQDIFDTSTMSEDQNARFMAKHGEILKVVRQNFFVRIQPILREVYSMEDLRILLKFRFQYPELYIKTLQYNEAIGPAVASSLIETFPQLIKLMEEIDP
jgi:hypothetical protein